MNKFYILFSLLLSVSVSDPSASIPLSVCLSFYLSLSLSLFLSLPLSLCLAFPLSLTSSPLHQDLAPDLGQRVVITNIWRHLQDDPMEFLPDFQKRRASFSEAAPSKPYSVTSTSGEIPLLMPG